MNAITQSLEAPDYPPSARFDPPRVLPHRLSIYTSSIAELQAHPEAWAIIVKAMPVAVAISDVAALKPHLGNFSFPSLIQFGLFPLGDVDAMERQLQALEEVQ